LAIARHRSASNSKLNAFPHFLLKSCELDTSELTVKKKKEGGRKKTHVSPLPTLLQLLD